MFSHDGITEDEIRQKLSEPESFEDFKRLLWTTIKYLMEKDSSVITYDNWKRYVAENPKVIEYLFKDRREGTSPPRV